MRSPRQADFEYIVVGSGAGGGPLAANLARAGRTVLLLEGGGDAQPLTYDVPAFHPLATEDTELCWNYFVRHYSDDARQARDPKFTAERDGVLYPRAGTLGGCSAHNAMITIYPHNHDWDDVAQATGDRSWRSSSMRRYFEKLERCTYVEPPSRLATWLRHLVRGVPWLDQAFGNRGRHGFHGWLTTALASPGLALRDGQLLGVIRAAVESALVEELGRPLALLERLQAYPDPNDWRVQLDGTEGLWLVPMATEQGRRTGTREYVRSVQSRYPDRLTVKTGSLATRVLFEEGARAVGVEYLEGPHLYRADPLAGEGHVDALPQRVLASREVILSAGAFNSPQLLQLSGIGPADELARLGIDVLVDLPGVGRNLQDRYEVGVVSEMQDDFALTRQCGFEVTDQGADDPCLAEWRAGRGVYTSNGAVLGISKKSRPERPDPDLFIFGLPARFSGYCPGFSRQLELGKNYFTWAILKAHTRNTAGSVRLRSMDPRDVPEIQFHYFDEGNDTTSEDLDSMIEGVQFVRRIGSRMSDITRREVVPGSTVLDRDQIADFIRDQAWGHHASCTCRIGAESDPLAVVGSDFRVHGTRNLRVVDASVFPRIPGFFIASAVYMVSEKASEVILSQEAGR